MIYALYFTTYLFEAFISFIYFSNRYERKTHPTLTAIAFALSCAVQFSASLIESPLVNILVFAFCNFLICILLFKCRWYFSVVNTLFLTLLMFITEFLILYSSGLIYTNEKVNLLVYLIQVMNSKLMYFIFAYFASKITFGKAPFHRLKNSLLLFLLPLASILVLYAVAYLAKNIILDNIGVLLFGIFSVLLMYSNIIVFLVYDSNLKAQRKKSEYDLLLRKQEIDTAYYSILEKQYEQSDILIHDIKRHLLSIKKLSELGDNQSIEKYIDDLYEDYEIGSIKKYSSNKLVNTIINRYAAEYKQDGISFFCDVRDVDFSKLSQGDLTAILDNLLENAFESGARSKEKIVELSIYIQNSNFLIFKLKNSCDNPPIKNGESFVSSKDGTNHGLGLKSVRRAVKKYSGNLEISYSDENKSFTSTVGIMLEN